MRRWSTHILLYWIPCIGFYGLLTYLSSLSALPHQPLFPHFDKIEHFFAYAFLGFLSFGALGQTNIFFQTQRFRGFYFLLGFLVLLGGIDELHQSFVPGRSMEATDLLADACGIVSAHFFYRWIFIRKKIPLVS